MTELQKALADLADPAYRDFQAKLMPTVDKERILGVRTPVLRGFAKEFNKSQEKENFLSSLPHFYYEENNLHAFLIEQMKDYDRTIKELEKFLPYVDNWATCDSMRPRVLEKNKEKFYPIIKEWLSSSDLYTVRFAMEQLMNAYLKEDFKEEMPRLVLEADNGEFYLSMMAAWYMATALAARKDDILPYYESKTAMRPETRKRAIRKAIESYRIDKELKNYLKGLMK